MYLHHRFIFTNQFTYKNGFILDLFNAANHNHNIFLYAERCSIIPLEPLISLIVKKIAPSRIPSIRFRSLEGTTRNREIRERTNSFHVLFYVLCESLDPLFTNVQIRLINLMVVSWFLGSRRSLLSLRI